MIHLEWDAKALADALHIPEENAIKMFRDGRACSPLLEERIANEFGWTRVAGNKDHDVVSTDSRKWEVRCMTKGVSFCPSNMIGSSRSFNETEMLQKLDAIDGFIICDIVEFPSVRLHPLECEQVRDLWNEYQTNDTAYIRRKQFLELNLPAAQL